MLLPLRSIHHSEDSHYGTCTVNLAKLARLDFAVVPCFLASPNLDINSKPILSDNIKKLAIDIAKVMPRGNLSCLVNGSLIKKKILTSKSKYINLICQKIKENWQKEITKQATLDGNTLNLQKLVQVINFVPDNFTFIEGYYDPNLKKEIILEQFSGKKEYQNFVKTSSAKLLPDEIHLGSGALEC